jgi:cullin 1
LLKKNIDHFISDSFLSDERFKSTSKESLTKGMNQKPGFICDTFSKYIDNVLREDADKLSLNEIKNIINEYMVLFKYIENKDLFENFFIKKLCIRCLFDLNKSEEAQNYLIEQLKNECGPYFVSKSQEMISDVKASQEMSQLFNKESENQFYIPVNYFVLSNYTWPIDKLIKGEIANFEIGGQEKKFFDFYHKKNSGKSLFWHLPYCFGEMEMQIADGSTIKITGNGVHFAILKCFNKSKESLTFKDILNKTKIEKDVIQRYIKKLINKNLLKYEEDIYSVNFEVNKDGKNKEIALIDYDEEENSKEDEDNEEKTIEERRFVIDAYIMKVLKQKKVMKREDLINTVKEKMPFEEKDDNVNKRIEQLINNRFISKDDNDNNLLKYC